MSEKKVKKKKIAMSIIVAAILIVSAFAIYTKVIIPKKYMSYINEGNKYLSEEIYEGAVEAFQNAINIVEDSTEAKLGQAKAYIGLNNMNKAKEILKEAIELDVKNENLLMSVLEILSDSDLNFSNELVASYTENVGAGNVSDKFRTEIIEYANRDEINKAIESAQQLHDNAVEGNEEGQYEEGSKAILLSMINESKEFSKNYLVQQSEVDIMTRRLKESMTSFECKVIQAFSEELINSYISRLKNIEARVDAAYDNWDLSNAEMGNILEDAQREYESILSEIYSDLYNKLPSSKKSLVEADENKYKSEKAQTEYEFENLDPMDIGTWVVQGIPEAFGELAKENCYYLIDKYMR